VELSDDTNFWLEELQIEQYQKLLNLGFYVFEGQLKALDYFLMNGIHVSNSGLLGVVFKYFQVNSTF